MCGIAGIINKASVVETVRLKAMTDAIKHRGPDGEGQWVNDSQTVGLGHRRLSIIDLSDAGSQPMHYLDRYVIVYNGEIYNYIELKNELLKKGYSFFSDSDTEVLMALYHEKKEKCLTDLDGMFAFAIYDRKEQVLFCARDRFGEKPFFYSYEKGGHFAFASEMKALWTGGIERKPNERMVFDYLQFKILQNPQDSSETFYAGIKRLKAAHYIKVDVESCRMIEEKKYWSIHLTVPQDISVDVAAERFRDLFNTSVKRRLRSDVPVGSSLSGGLDSSLVVMSIDELKRETSQLQKTFSARFRNFHKDEGQYMQLVIDRCKIEPHFVYPDDETMLKELGKVIYHQEEPFGSASICVQYLVYQLAKQNDVTVLLDGQGADEILAGYHYYFRSFFSELRKADKKAFRQEWEAYQRLHENNQINEIEKKNLKYYFRLYAAPWVDKARELRQHYKQRLKPELNKSFYETFSKEGFMQKPTFDTLNETLLSSATEIGLEELLRYADRNSMAHSLEVRLPFLSHELVEFLFSLPATYKIKEGWTKWLMRYTFQNLLPAEITWRKDKIGYEPPQQKWMENTDVKEMIVEKRKVLVRNGILDKRILDEPVLAETAGISRNNSWAHLMIGSLYDL
jgi:asparagine synthase (glutamine-hydrolysing)